MSTEIPSPARARRERCKDALGLTPSELHALVAVVVRDLYEHRASTYNEVTDLCGMVNPDTGAWAGQHLLRLERLGLLRSDSRDGEGNRRFYRATERGVRTVLGWAGRWLPARGELT
jgi:hypothetical protein